MATARLGRRVPVHADARLLRCVELAAAAAASLGEHDALVPARHRALTTGTTPGVAVTRM